MTTKLEGRGMVKALVVGPLVKELFFEASLKEHKKIILYSSILALKSIMAVSPFMTWIRTVAITSASWSI